MITNRTQLNAVIGYPLGHSQSPLLHNALYKKLNIDAVLVALPHKDIKRLAEVIKTANIGLTVVTMPFKQSIRPFLDEIDERAKAIGAVNTVINKKGKLMGYNTDIDGIASALSGVPLAGKNVLLIGAGGAARAVAYFLHKKRANIVYLNRTKSKARKLQKDFSGKTVNLNAVDPAQMDVIINATSVGMESNALPIPKSFLRKEQYVFDVVYNVNSTELLRQAKKRGAKTISGMEMFIGQGLRQVELYTGKALNTNKMKKYAHQIIKQSQ